MEKGELDFKLLRLRACSRRAPLTVLVPPRPHPSTRATVDPAEEDTQFDSTPRRRLFVRFSGRRRHVVAYAPV